MKALIILAHPDIEGRSIANKIIVDRVKDVPGVEVRDLYRMYPDFNIDVESEQAALISADMIIFQFPFYWYGMPGMLKEWMDRVFVYGFAFGSEGVKCKGKQFLVSTTVGAPADAYREGGNNNFTIPEFLRPLEQAANLSGMVFNPHLFTHDMIYIPDVYNKKEDVERRAREHAEKLVAFIEGK